MSMQKRKYGNRSSINFAAFREHQNDPQEGHIYQPHSQLAQLINDYPCTPVKTSTQFAKNIITNTAQHYQAPLPQQLATDAENRPYLQFLDHHRAFVKPYGPNTKYIDLLSRNKALLRNDQTAAATTTAKASKLQKKKVRNNRKFRYFRHSEKHQNLSVTKQANTKDQQSTNLFERTINTQISLYKALCNKDRSQKSQSVSLGNSMNRILAAESIAHELYPKSRHIHHTEGDD